MKDEIIEQKLRNIVNSDKPKYIIIDGKKIYVSRPKIDQIKQKEKQGGIFPLIPLIIGGIAAAGSVAGGAAGIAKAVDDKKAHDLRQKEQERHNKELEKAARGDGFNKSKTNYYSAEKAIKEFSNMIESLDKREKRALKNTMDNLADFIKIEKKGDGLFLNPYRK